LQVEVARVVCFGAVTRFNEYQQNRIKTGAHSHHPTITFSWMEDII